MRDRLFFAVLFGFLGGVLIGSFLNVNLAFVFFGASVVLVFLLVAVLHKEKKEFFILAAIAVLGLSIGFLRFYMKDVKQPKQTLDNFVEQNVSLSGIIEEEVEHRQSNQRILLSADKIMDKGNEYPIHSNILISTDLYPEYAYGDRVVASGKLMIPKNFTTDAGKEFDYVDYLKKDSIYYTMSFAKVVLVEKDKASPVKSFLLKIKGKFLNAIEDILPPPESGLLAGLILGIKSSLPEELQAAFVDTGLVHVIVLSGYNVTIIAESLIKMLSFASVATGIYVGAAGIILFAVMTGGGSTIIRASIMAILALYARATGRNYDIIRALLFAAFIMVLINPYILVFDISFQLSFLATLGLIFMSPIFKEKFKFLPERFGIREIAGATIGVQVFVLPFILYKMGNLSLIAPITNLIILPFIPMTMFFGFIASSLAFIHRLVAMPFSFISYILLKFEIITVKGFAKLPFASLHLSYFPFALVLIFYIFLAWYLYHYYEKHPLSY